MRIEFSIDELEQLAKKATKGLWWMDSHGETLVSCQVEGVQHICNFKHKNKPKRNNETGNLSGWPNDWDATFIATANPENILSLISRLRDVERQLACYLPPQPEPEYACHACSDKLCDGTKIYDGRKCDGIPF